MKITPLIEDVLNKQICYEHISAYAYLGLAAALQQTPFSGFAHWMKKQYEEELEHAMRIYDYIFERQGAVKLQNFDCPVYTIKCPCEAFKIAYQLELENTQHIHDAYALAIQEKDYPTQVFLNWFIDEQVEEESNCQTYIGAIALAMDDKSALLRLDHQAGKRD